MIFTHNFQLWSCVLISTFFSQLLPTSAAVHYVDVNGNNPVAPYSAWVTAAQTIQEAIDVSSVGDLVLVTNGIYGTGGRPTDGVLTNRVSIDKALTLRSVNGPIVTVIEGANGIAKPGLARGVWITNDAVISGFTIRGGAATQSGGSVSDLNGGGIRGSSRSGGAIATNCIICTNIATANGGGASLITILNCTVSENIAGSATFFAYGGGIDSCFATNCTITGNNSIGNGGGASFSDLRNCAVTQNRAVGTGGGTAGMGTLVNCTVTGNTTSSISDIATGGTFGNALVNCLVYGNKASGSNSNFFSCVFSYSCTSPLPTGTGNFDADPQLRSDGIHLGGTSPCRGAGTVLLGPDSTDIDGQSWANPPSIGCDEYLTPPPVVISSVALIGTNFTLSFPGQPGASYVVDQTSDLTPPAQWQTIANTNANGTNLLQITDTDATNGFYRIRAQ